MQAPALSHATGADDSVLEASPSSKQEAAPPQPEAGSSSINASTSNGNGVLEAPSSGDSAADVASVDDMNMKSSAAGLAPHEALRRDSTRSHVQHLEQQLQHEEAPK